ncbi:MAG: hypothetical protein SFY92_03970 [Verrucomicrobiae bacterium]|nr:hypothetical protein [Verrucomicrobiae bacterium]
MKSAYELAMERLDKSGPAVKLTALQKEQIAEIDNLYRSRIAERELFLQGEIAGETLRGRLEEAEALRQQLARDRRALETECEEKKEKIRREK